MNRLVFCVIAAIMCTSSIASARLAVDHSPWNQILSQYTQNGRVDYQALALDRGTLDSYVSEMKRVGRDDLDGLDREERIAFWINFYNARVIQIVLDAYPVESIEDIPVIEKARSIRALGESMNVYDLRDRILRQNFRDERILIALVSGRIDSPRLHGEAFQGDRLDNQLDEVSRKFVEDVGYNQIEPGKKIYLSRLFRDYQDDFILNYGVASDPDPFSNAEAAVISFILHHMDDPDKRLFLNSGRYKIEYLPEKHLLNDVSIET